MGIIDSQCLYRKSLVDFLLSSGSPRTLQVQADGTAKFLRTCVGYVFSININIFPFPHKFFILDRIFLCIDYRSNEYPDVVLIREVKDALVANENFILGFMHSVFYIMFLFLCSWLLCRMIFENFTLYLCCFWNMFILKSNSNATFSKTDTISSAWSLFTKVGFFIHSSSNLKKDLISELHYSLS